MPAECHICFSPFRAVAQDPKRAHLERHRLPATLDSFLQLLFSLRCPLFFLFLLPLSFTFFFFFSLLGVFGFFEFFFFFHLFLNFFFKFCVHFVIFLLLLFSFSLLYTLVDSYSRLSNSGAQNAV